MCLFCFGYCPDAAGELLQAIFLQGRGSPDPVASPVLRKRGGQERGRCSERRMGLVQRLVEERDKCVCTEIQKNATPWYEFGDLLKNLNKLLYVKRYCSPLLVCSYFSKIASSSKELTVVGRSASLLHGGI